MNQKHKDNINEIAQALFVVNRHAKTAPNPRFLYSMKKQTIHKLLKNNQALKVGLHFSDHPKLSHQHSTVLVKVGEYFFHIPPMKQDFKDLKHLGNVDSNYRNPKPQMSLSQAKKILSNYLDWSLETKQHHQKERYPSYFTPSSLGQLNGSPFKKKKWRY
ncbi:YkyB family protein [Aquibacillus albus]|uniref:YkyB-like protein n=1 Tax=Aquibacillus albus TaxID=1168171 RepID=A0ABS2N265_9BACI|nr:hypothetical protein [Aquibacillus albus]